MDKGTSGGVPSTELEASGASGDFSQPTGESADFDEFVKERGDLAPKMEQPEAAPEVEEANVVEETVEAEAPKEEAPVEATPQESKEVADLRQIAVTRDAESLPKEYVAAVAKIVEANKRDPHELVDSLDKARWDMLEKAFGRKLGDGLNGGKAA